ncbi:MAG: peptidoglycan-binding domain-containing protein [Dermatophilaceae bacterium]|jgi:peptidoglycan hydrolase-like protein with peptidoglycan-binding domain
MGKFAAGPRSLLSLAAAVAALLVGLALVIDRHTPSPLADDLPPREVIVPVTSRQVRSSDDVQVRMHRRPGDRIRLAEPALLTSLNVQIGATVKPGDLVATVADRPLTAYTASAPPYRDLGPGSSGPDVERLQAFLRTLGRFDGDPNGRFDRRTESAVRSFNRDRGVGDLGGSLPATSLVWIGPAQRVVASISAVVGEVPADGILFTAPATPQRLEVIEPRGGLRRPDEAKLLALGALTATYVPGSGAVTDPASLAAFDAALGEAQVPAKVIGATSFDVATVPATAVLTDATGMNCVVDPQTRRRIVVKPVGGSVGLVDLEASLSIDQVLVNPAILQAAQTCVS